VPLDLSDAFAVDVYESVAVPVLVPDVVYVALCVSEADIRGDLEPVGECVEVFETLIEPVVVALISGLYDFSGVNELLTETVELREARGEYV